jgi:hypothetical protein
MSLSKPSVGQKHKRKTLSLHDKLSVIEKLEKGVSVSSTYAEYGIAKQSMSDIKKAKSDICNFVLKFNVEKEKSELNVCRFLLLLRWMMQCTSGFLSFVHLG